MEKNSLVTALLQKCRIINAGCYHASPQCHDDLSGKSNSEVSSDAAAAAKTSG